MRMVDLIEKKRDGHELSKEEIFFIINNYTKKKIPDYQMSSFLMAVYFKSMSDKESAYLTEAMLKSGDIIDLESIPGIKVDKHSTGGVGDKTTLVLGPLVASCGVKVAKLSGRGLGHTGGTLDKLESIKGLSINIDIDDFIKQVNDIGIAVAGQTKNLTPADKMMYALRDVTGTVPSIPLIASSIMSKKLASGSDVICLDVKIGDGAFMKTIEEARELSKIMVSIGKNFDKKVIAFITNMDQPLGFAVGNKLEVLEAINTLKGNGPSDLQELCIEIGSYMIYNADITNSVEDAKAMILENIKNENAYEKFNDLITAQGGKEFDVDNFIKVNEIIGIKSNMSGYIKEIKALDVGLSAMRLGAGRETKDDDIDTDVGIVLNKKVSDYVNQGDILAYMYINKTITEETIQEVHDAFILTEEEVQKPSVILEIIK